MHRSKPCRPKPNCCGHQQRCGNSLHANLLGSQVQVCTQSFEFPLISNRVLNATGGTYTAAIVRLPQEEAHVQQEADLKGHEGTIHKVMWHPRNAQLLATIEDASLRIWSLTDGAVKVSTEGALYTCIVEP